MAFSNNPARSGYSSPHMGAVDHHSAAPMPALVEPRVEGQPAHDSRIDARNTPYKNCLLRHFRWKWWSKPSLWRSKHGQSNSGNPIGNRLASPSVCVSLAERIWQNPKSARSQSRLLLSSHAHSARHMPRAARLVCTQTSQRQAPRVSPR